MSASALPRKMGGCGAEGCYVCWDGDHLSRAAYWSLRRVETMLTDAVERTPIDWDKIRKVTYWT